jgi:hypothetical protein
VRGTPRRSTAPQPTGYVAPAGQREEHAGREVEVGIDRRKGRRDDDEVHEPAGEGNPDLSENENEGAAAQVAPLLRDGRPRAESHDDPHRQHIKEDEPQHQSPQGPGYGVFRAFRFPRRDRHGLDSDEAGDRQSQGQEDATKAVRKEAAGGRQV